MKKKLILVQLPHHTLGSWKTRLSAPKVNEEIEKLRKRAGIEARKSQAMSVSGMSATPGPSDVLMRDVKEPVPLFKTEPSPYEQEDDHQRLVQEDIEVAATFFANTNMQEETNDDKIYKLLAAHVSSWQFDLWHVLM